MTAIKLTLQQIGITLNVGQYTTAPIFKAPGIAPRPGVQVDINANSGPPPLTTNSPSPNLIQLQFPSGRILAVTSLYLAAQLCSDTPWGLLSKLVAAAGGGLIHLEPNTPALYGSWLGFQLNLADATTVLLPAPKGGSAPPVLGALTVTATGTLVATATDSEDFPPNMQVPFVDLWTVAAFAGVEPLQLLALIGTAPNVKCEPP